MSHDLDAELRWSTASASGTTPLQHAGGQLWQAMVTDWPTDEDLSWALCATDRQRNEACTDEVAWLAPIDTADTGPTGSTGDTGPTDHTALTASTADTGTPSTDTGSAPTQPTATTNPTESSTRPLTDSGAAGSSDDDGRGCGCVLAESPTTWAWWVARRR